MKYEIEVDKDNKCIRRITTQITEDYLDESHLNLNIQEWQTEIVQLEEQIKDRQTKIATYQAYLDKLGD